MGFCSSAIVSYGIILNNEEIINLLRALGRDMHEIDRALGSREYADVINDWIQRGRPSHQIAPFYFRVIWEYRESDSDSDSDSGRGKDVKLAIILEGEDETDYFRVPNVEIWGKDDGMAFTAIPQLNDEELMESAKKKFEKLKSTKAFQEAQFTAIVPQWILRLDITVD
ncbi:hypothetical protein C0992_001010 [Termitomyces sp. T32_za158]|nr:hypothetical protein C0992_001010 [Termitomyces sp. T32_za158]